MSLLFMNTKNVSFTSLSLSLCFKTSASVIWNSLFYILSPCLWKQFTNRAVKLWLDHLKQLLYDAEDILDEYATELLRLKLEYARHTQEVRNSVPYTPSTESSISSWLNFGIESAIKGINGTFEGIKEIGSKAYGMAEELLEIKRFGSKVRDIDQRLKRVAQEGVALGLNSSIGFGSSRPMVFSQRPPTSSLVNKYKVFGREEDMEKIVRWLLSDKTQFPSDNNNNFSVLPIVGMGGVGKTTIAQLVYNDVKVKKHFQLKGWVCVSEDFDVVRLTKEILESVTGSSPPISLLDLLQVRLQEALTEKRFLLVLDDMWNENYERWDALCTIFSFGEPGNKILVTTRHKGVASMLCTVPNDAEVTEFEAMKSLRSFLTLVDTVGSPRKFFPTVQFKFQFQFLRVLRFRNCCNCELPDSIGKLKHLRLLDLSFSDIIRLPCSVGNLSELPTDMSNLVNLRCLFLPTQLGFHKIPSGVGYLTGLESLNTFDAAPKKMLSQLCGSMKNSNLGNVSSNGAEAMVAMPHLHGLQLHNLMSFRVLQIPKCENLQSLSKELYTLTSLQRLLIGSCPDLVSFPETRLPIALQELKIFDCENPRSLSKELPTSLKEFVIDGCPALVSFPETGLPPALEELDIIDCKNLETLPMGLLHGLMVFHRLEIKECPTLESIPDVGLSNALREVSILHCGQLNSLPRGVQNLSNLKQLEIVESSFPMQCKNLEPLHTSGLHSLISLSYLTIGGCHALVSIPKGMLPTNLRDFCIKDCPILEFAYDGLSDLTSL